MDALRLTDYTEREQLGRQVYIREGCWYCHSQFVRPVTGEDAPLGSGQRGGRVRVRRAASLLHPPHRARSHPGRAWFDEWHLAHFDPRMLTPDSIMPRFVGLFDVPGERVAIVDDDAGNRTLEQNEVTEAVFDFSKKDTPAEHLRLTPTPTACCSFRCAASTR